MRNKRANGSAAYYGNPFVIQVREVKVSAMNKLTADLLDR